MGPIADRDIPLDGGDLTRFGPNTTARLLDVILFKSHLSITCNSEEMYVTTTSQTSSTVETHELTLDKNCTMYLSNV